MRLEINNWKLDLEQDFVEYIDNEYATKDIAPTKDKLYRALELTSLNDVKVVIFGQDPYPTKGVATGLAFSSNGKLPGSLRNMFKELNTDLGVERVDTNLSDWAEQGVLLLNTSLMVEVGNAGSHSKVGWMDVTVQVIEQINNIERKVVFVLLGNHAQKLEKYIAENNHVLKFTHPSPLSASRGFFGSKPYSKINQLLEDEGYAPIDFGDKQTKLF